jgi:Spy/CpxP family protein refolding chaperone
MKTVLIAVGFIAAGLVGGLAGGMLFAPEEAASSAPEEPSRMAEWQRRVDDTLADIDDRLRLLETAPGYVADEPEISSAPPSPVATDGTSGGEGGETPLASADPELREKVLDIVEQKEKEDREARDARRAEMAEQFEAARLDRLAEQLGLNSYQKNELKRILAERRQKMLEMREKYFSGDGRPDPSQFALFREEMTKVREESGTQLQAVLTPEQYETFKEQDRGGRGGGPGRGGFGGRPRR